MVLEMEVFELKVLKLKVSKLKVSNLKGLSKFSPKVSLVMNICGTLFFLIFELFDPIPCWLWNVGLILVFCLTSRFRLSSKFSAFPAFIIDNINISAKTLNRKWILINLIRLGQKTTTKRHKH